MQQARGLLIGDIFRNAARAVPHRPAMWLGDGHITFGEIDAASDRVVTALTKRGVSPGDSVVVAAGTSLDAVPLFAALAKMGAVYVPINPALSGAEAEQMVTAARPRLIIAADGRPGATDLSDLLEAAAKADPTDTRTPAIDERGPHVVFFTSGSSGRPKGAILSHRVNYLRSHPGALLEPRGAKICPFPLFHMAAWTIALQQWHARDAVVLVEATDAPTIAAATARHRATRMNAIPAIWRRLLDHGTAELETLRFADTGTSATPIELLQEMHDALPQAQLRIFYGSTEAGNVASLAPDDVLRKPGSCGLPSHSTTVRTADDGELWVTGPLLFDGYLDNPEATGAALHDGWYRTGDVANIDDEGYLSIVGRVGEVIRTGGEGVAPSEVEAILATHPSIREVAVIGIPDARWGEVVCAVVVLVEGAAAPSVDEVRAHCASRLAPFKHPRRVDVVEAIPRTPATGQIRRKALVERFS